MHPFLVNFLQEMFTGLSTQPSFEENAFKLGNSLYSKVSWVRKRLKQTRAELTIVYREPLLSGTYPV